MRIASTGLGKTELRAVIFDLQPKGNCIGLHATTDYPDGCKGWHLETYLEPQDILPVVLGFLRPGILWLIIKSFVFPLKNPKEPEKL
jgi:hypothetical protein